MLFFASGVYCFYEVSSFTGITATANKRIKSSKHLSTAEKFKYFPKNRITRSRTSLEMVFTAPESIVEQVSTQDFIDKLLDDCLLTRAKQPIMVQFIPSSRYIWKRWKGTVFSDTWKSCVRHVIVSTIVFLISKLYPESTRFIFSKFHVLWAQLLSVTTFTLTFFVNQSYNVFKTCINTCRIVQGRLNDVIMSLAGSAERNDDPNNDSSQFTPQSKNIMLVVSRYIRLFNILYYASLTRSHRPLLTPLAMRRMVSRGLITQNEYDLLMEPSIPATQRHNIVLMWMYRVSIEGREAGHVNVPYRSTISKFQDIRAKSASIESLLRARMPFAYVHIVQVLVDTILWTYPLMALSEGMNLSFHLTLVGSAVLTASYQGLFDLAKQFLDPFHNENFWNGEDSLVVETLIAETNAGSMRWINCLNTMPMAYQSLKTGKLDEHILPVHGFSKEDADAKDEMLRIRKQEEKETELNAVAAAVSNSVFNEDKIIIQQYIEEEVAKELEAVQEEFETTKNILNAPPASDFVPGVDDKNSTEPYDFGDDMKEEKLEKFMDKMEEEFEETKEMIEGKTSKIS